MKQRNLVVRWGIAALVLVVGTGPVHAQTGPLRGLDAYVERAMREWEVPGVAVAVVRGDSVVFAKGYGVRELGKPGPVDEHTLFGIMSTTKAFTSAAVAMLVDEEKVRWDDPVVEHLPGFQLPAPFPTREFTVRDLLAHRAGLERGDFLWFGSGYDRDAVVHHIRYLEPVAGFRAEYGYSNNMYIAAGQLVAAVSGMSWDDFVDRRIFTPLGMTASNTSVVALRDAGNVAMPHEALNGTLQPIAYRSLDNEAAGGSINSTAMEMAQWLRLQLGNGEYRGKRLISEKALKETRTPQTVIHFDEAAKKTNPGLHFLFYAMGWTAQDYRGHRLVQHSGGIDGLRSRVALLPDKNLGLVVLTNKGRWNALADVIRNWILDSHLGVQPPNWSTVFMEAVRAEMAAADSAEQALIAARVPGTSLSLPLKAYTGEYKSRAYGNAYVRLENGSLVAQLGPSIVGDLEHWHHNTFKATWRNPYLGWSLVSFELDAGGKVVALDNANWWPDYRRAETSNDPE